jgi:hypothetical protein
MAATDGESVAPDGSVERGPAAAGAEADRQARETRIVRLVDLVVAIVLAIAAVGTAWAGFQSAKWSGVQANSYAAASAARTDANRMSAIAGQQRTVDVVSFTQWLTALNQELGDDPAMLAKVRNYEPNPRKVSGFMFERFRDEFKPVVQAWLDTQPLINTDAPATPFEVSEYSLAAEQQAAQLEATAEQKSATARQANQRSDNYVLTTVIFALVLFFAALVGRMNTLRTQKMLTGIAVVALLGAITVMLTFPIEI